MKKSNSSFTNFLDKTYIPMAKRTKVILLIFVFVLPVAAFYFLFLQSNLEQQAQLEKKKTRAQTELNKAKAQARNLPKLERELAQTQEEFDQKAALLPREKEIPQLLRDISSLGRNAGLDFLVFRPKPNVPKDFYDEIPVSINIRGPYHNIGYFVDQVSKLDRIVTVSSINITNPQKEGGELIVKSDCQLLTYQFTNRELPKDNKKKKK